MTIDNSTIKEIQRRARWECINDIAEDLDVPPRVVYAVIGASYSVAKPHTSAR
jgi:hypothetical protein